MRKLLRAKQAFNRYREPINAATRLTNFPYSEPIRIIAKLNFWAQGRKGGN